MEKGDIVVHYMTSKKDDTQEVNTSLLVSIIYKYVQNKEIYFQYEPNFFKGVLIFGVVGFAHDHEELQKVLGGDMEKLNCNLIVTLKQKQDIGRNSDA